MTRNVAPIITTAAALALALGSASGCGDGGSAESSPEPTPGTQEPSPESSAEARSPEPFKITVPQNDLEVAVDGFRIVPPMGLGSWAAFAPTGSGSEMLVVGDLVLREEEIRPVQAELLDRGLTFTGLHNHFVRAEPPVMFMHIRGVGARDSLRAAVEAVLGRVAELRGGDPAAAEADAVENTLDTERLAEILGHDGSASRGVWKVTVGRPDVELASGGVRVTTEMGFNTWASWQGSMEAAAVAGDFVMLEDEVAPVIEALVEAGIEVVAVHNHMVHEEPRTFFLHYWGTGPAEELAQGLRAALDRTGAAPDAGG